MKRVRVTVVLGLILIVLALAYSQSPQTTAQPRKTIDVTTRTLARQPRGRPYIVDLTRPGKPYTVSVDVAERVRVRTPKGETALSDLLKKIKITSSKFLIGTGSDLRALNFGIGPNVTSATAAASNFSCGPVLPVCECDGFGDCLALSFQCDTMLCTKCDRDCGPESVGKMICFCFRGPIVIK